MAHYRLYLLDDDNHIRKAVILDCPDDTAALVTAKSYVDGCAVELWEKTRQVARLPATHKKATESCDAGES